MLKGKRIFVTGGTGFLGRHLLPRLMEQGCEVTCLVRDPRARLPEGIRKIQGDLATGSGPGEAAAGHDIVIHMAAMLFGHDWREYLRVNTLAAYRLIEACGSDRPKLIHVSSLAAAGPAAKKPGRSEMDPPEPVSAYGWSKLAAEKTIQAARPDAIILRPPIIYGSGDRGLLPVFKSVKRGFAPSPGAFRQFPISAIHADDMARAIILAAQKDARGVFHLSDGQYHTMDSFCAAMGKAQGKKRVRMLHVPLPVMGMSAYASGIIGAAFAGIAAKLNKRIRPAQWNMDKFLEAREAGWLANPRKIMDELGFEPQTSLESGMREAVAGYREDNWL